METQARGGGGADQETVGRTDSVRKAMEGGRDGREGVKREGGKGREK